MVALVGKEISLPRLELLRHPSGPRPRGFCCWRREKVTKVVGWDIAQTTYADVVRGGGRRGTTLTATGMATQLQLVVVISLVLVTCRNRGLLYEEKSR